jgi:hypothetical protein
MSPIDVNPSAGTEGTYTPDDLHAGDYPMATETVTILTGQTLLRGALLGKITASGKYVLSLSAAGDGSQVPRRILLHDIDASAADKLAPAAVTGEFNERRVIFGTGHTAASTREALADLSIFLRPSVSR